MSKVNYSVVVPDDKPQLILSLFSPNYSQITAVFFVTLFTSFVKLVLLHEVNNTFGFVHCAVTSSNGKVDEEQGDVK